MINSKEIADENSEIADSLRDLNHKMGNGEIPLLLMNRQTIIPGCTIPISDADNIAEIAEIQNLKQMTFACFTRLESKSNSAKKQISGYGCLAQVAGAVQQQEGKVAVLVRGIGRVKLQSLRSQNSIFWGKVEPLPPPTASQGVQVSAQLRTLETMLTQLGHTQGSSEVELAIRILKNEEVHIALYLIALNLNLTKQQLAAVLGQDKLETLLAFLITRLAKEVEISKISHRIHKKVQSGIDGQIKRNFLREQMFKIRKELKNLGDKLEDDGTDELIEYKKFIGHEDIPTDLKKMLAREIEKIEGAAPGSPEIGISVGFLQFVCELPWPHLEEKSSITPPTLDATQLLNKAQEILDRDHYGLTEVKRRILESILVQHQTGKKKSNAILFVGPPGVGKTSLTKSIATALGRKYARVALGGVSDEAEIRGHRRTYIGAMAGRILEALQKAGTRHTVMLLDEVDKAGHHGGHRNVSGALLELLDPSQNHSFSDHYLGYPFDFSEVMFVATANSLKDMDPALVDRMEVIELSSYTVDEKAHIGKDFILRQCRTDLHLEDHELDFTIADMKAIVEGFTREAGVRELDRTLKSLSRKYLYYKVEKDHQEGSLQKSGHEWIQELLGPKKFDDENILTDTNQVGVTTGLAYTSVGGDVLFIESRLLPSFVEQDDKQPQLLKNLVLTGSIGKVMQESAQTAFSYILSHYKSLHLNVEALYHNQIHIHLPAGATPKDGPSAGITMFAAMVSLVLNKPVRSSFAMTGEITLRGEVLPVGGIKEKVIAAHNRGYRKIILPLKNWGDLKEVDAKLRKDLSFYPVAEMQQVLAILGLHPDSHQSSETQPIWFDHQNWKELLPQIGIKQTTDLPALH
ncbi:MAG: endopeptidase La [Zetaproteobacteria bacterium]|nr:endopeptidase La [Zetaproteobacteria bacterium]